MAKSNMPKTFHGGRQLSDYYLLILTACSAVYLIPLGQLNIWQERHSNLGRRVQWAELLKSKSAKCSRTPDTHPCNFSYHFTAVFPLYSGELSGKLRDRNLEIISFKKPDSFETTLLQVDCIDLLQSTVYRQPSRSEH